MDQYADGSGPVATDDDNSTDNAQASGPTIYNPRLVQLRANHLQQLQDPNLRSFATRALLAEGGANGLASNFEQLSNYANARGIGLKDALTSGFYGPVNNGTIASSLSPAQAAAGDAAINSVFSQGRNKIGYRIDQGMIGDPNYNTEQNSEYRPAKIDGSFFADHPAVGVGWAQKQLALDKAAGINPDNQFEADGSPIAAINSAAGVKTPSGKGALAFSGSDDDDDDSDTGALKPGKGALNTIFAGDKDSGGYHLGRRLIGVAAALASITNPAQAAQLNAMAKQRQDDETSKYQVHIGADGTIYRSDPSTGEVQAIKGPGTPKGNFQAIPDGMGGYKVLNKNTGTFVNDGGGTQAPAQQIGGDPSLTGQERYNSMSAQDQRTIDGWFNGTGVMPSNVSLRGPSGQKIMRLMDAAQAVYGDSMDFSRGGERTAFAKGYASKSPSSEGGQLLRTSTALHQIGDLGQNYLDLNNSAGVNPQGFGSDTTSYLANRGKDFSGGAPRQTALNNLRNNALTTSNEVQTVLSQGRSAEGERSQRQSTYNQPDASPLVQAGILRTELGQITNRYNDAVASARSTMGQQWLDRHPEIEQTFQKETARIKGMADELERRGGGATTAAAPAAAPSGGARPPIASFFPQ